MIGLILLVILPSGSASTTEGHCNTLEAAFTVTSEDVRRTYFLSGAEYIEYSLYRGSERKVGPITELGLDSALRHTDAAFTLADGSVVFIKRCRYFRWVNDMDVNHTRFLHLTSWFCASCIGFQNMPNWSKSVLYILTIYFISFSKVCKIVNHTV